MSILPTWQQAINAGNAGVFGNVWIRSAAIWQGDEIYEGPRHCEIILDMRDAKVPKAEHVQGFVTNLGVFINREDATKLALSNGQIKVKQNNQRDLFSEELWSWKQIERN